MLLGFTRLLCSFVTYICSCDGSCNSTMVVTLCAHSLHPQYHYHPSPPSVHKRACTLRTQTGYATTDPLLFNWKSFGRVRKISAQTCFSFFHCFLRVSNFVLLFDLFRIKLISVLPARYSCL